METEKKLRIVESVAEFAIGYTIGAAGLMVIKPQGAFQKAMTVVGSTAIALVAGNAFHREFADYCETVFDVDLNG